MLRISVCRFEIEQASSINVLKNHIHLVCRLTSSISDGLFFICFGCSAVGSFLPRSFWVSRNTQLLERNAVFCQIYGTSALFLPIPVQGRFVYSGEATTTEPTKRPVRPYLLPWTQQPAWKSLPVLIPCVLQSPFSSQPASQQQLRTK